MEEKLLDVGSERAVLAGLLQYGIDAYVAVSDLISVDSFGNKNNKIIYRCIDDIISNDQVPDIATLLASAEQLNCIEQISTKQELSYIKSLYDFPVSQQNIFSFAVQMKKFESHVNLLIDQ